MAKSRPDTIAELIEFYYQDFKPLYGHLQSLNEPPVEMFFELNAAFDHLSRHWKYGQSEEDAVVAASAHIKRACFDAFKIVVRETVDHYNELRTIDTSIIDNGDFDRHMRQDISEIKRDAIAARQAEGDSRDADRWHDAYDLWCPVYVKCREFDEAYYLNQKVCWARKKQKWRSWRRRLEGVVIGMVAGLLVWWLTTVASCASRKPDAQSVPPSPATQPALGVHRP